MDSTARHRCLSTVDRLVLERGELDPLEFLLAMGCLDYADYREWRQRRRRELQSALTIPVEEVTAALAHAQAYAAEQHLGIEVCPPTAWKTKGRCPSARQRRWRSCAASGSCDPATAGRGICSRTAPERSLWRRSTARWQN